MGTSPPPVDPAAAAATFCARAAALAKYRRLAAALDASGEIIADIAGAERDPASDVYLVSAWRDCEAAGVTLADLYRLPRGPYPPSRTGKVGRYPALLIGPGER